MSQSVMPRDPSLKSQFWKQVQEDPTGCWLWIGRINGNGYGWYSRRVAHRVAYEALVGPIGTGLELDHLCRVRRCVNPKHLEPVTHAENLRRGDTIIARAAEATHCPQDHPYSGTNLYVPPDGSRRCRECARARNRACREADPNRHREQTRMANRRWRAKKSSVTPSE